MFDLTLNLDFYVFYKISGEHQESDYVSQCMVVVNASSLQSRSLVVPLYTNREQHNDLFL